MSTEQKTTSLELSKALEEAGVKQESEKWWYRHDKTGEYEVDPFCDGHQERMYSSFDCHELLEGLPLGEKVLVSSTHDRTYTARCGCIDDSETEQCGTPAEALGELKLWYLENGHCEKSKGES